MTWALRLGYRPCAPAPVGRKRSIRNRGSMPSSHTPLLRMSATYSVRPSGESLTSWGMALPPRRRRVWMTRRSRRSTTIIAPENSQLA